MLHFIWLLSLLLRLQAFSVHSEHGRIQRARTTRPFTNDATRMAANLPSSKAAESAQKLPLNLDSAQINQLEPDTRFRYRVRQYLQFGDSVKFSENPGLYQWIRTQRYEYRMRMQGKNSLLTPERIELLDSLDFDWQLDSQDGLTNRWMKRYQELQEFYHKEGHTVLRASDGSLGKWVANQRHQYKKWQRGETPCSMTPKRIQLLNELDMVWNHRAAGQTKNDVKWFARFREYQAGKDHSPSLKRWIFNQRKAFRNSVLSKQRQELLEQVGFDFHVNGTIARHEAQWEWRYRELQEFYAIHNHTRVHASDSRNLYRWVRDQRLAYRQWEDGKKSSLTLNRIQKLEEIGFEWDWERRSWETSMQELVDFQAKHGHTRVLPNQSLYGWIKNQRALYRQSLLSENRVKQLEHIGFEWTASRKEMWESRLAELVNYQTIHGHTRVQYNDSPSLCHWVWNQRKLYRQLKDGKKSSLSFRRIQRLEDIGFEWTT